ncbi:MAG TPA: hypothetical protein VGX00_08505 [Thermoplasmata archaeon]|nr:hypothetical protein [Thermoplasmata archaeon]
MRLFGSKKPTAPPAPPEPEPESEPEGGDRRFDKVIEIYPSTVKLLWHFFQPSDAGKEEGAPKEYPGPIEESVADGIQELEKLHLIEVIPSFGDFGVTAKMTKQGLQLMASQSEPGRLRTVRLIDPSTLSGTVFREVSMGD